MDDVLFEFTGDDGVQVRIAEGTLSSDIRVYENGDLVASVDCMTLLEAITSLTARIAELEAELARVSDEFGLPPTIGPAPGEIKRIIGDKDRRIAELEAERDRLRVECEAWRRGLLEYDEDPDDEVELWRAYLQNGWVRFNTITAAVDALMAEWEVTP
jgi:hypothetical protein